MEQIALATKFLLFYGMQAFAIGLVVGIGVIATLCELVRDRMRVRRAATLEVAHGPVKHS